MAAVQAGGRLAELRILKDEGKTPVLLLGSDASMMGPSDDPTATAAWLAWGMIDSNALNDHNIASWSTEWHRHQAALEAGCTAL